MWTECAHFLCRTCLRHHFLSKKIGFQPLHFHKKGSSSPKLIANPGSSGLKCPTCPAFIDGGSLMPSETILKILNCEKKEENGDGGQLVEEPTEWNENCAGRTDTTDSQILSKENQMPEQLESDFEPVFTVAESSPFRFLTMENKARQARLIEGTGGLQPISSKKGDHGSCAGCRRDQPFELLIVSCNSMHNCCLDCLSRRIHRAVILEAKQQIPKCPGLYCQEQILRTAVSWVKDKHENILINGIICILLYFARTKFLSGLPDAEYLKSSKAYRPYWSK